MKSLGYPRLMSMENFRTPNFELVADCLHWLIQRYDPTVELNDEISTEGDRVAFLKAAVQIMLKKARIKLNPKRIYAADGHAVKELLKIATVLYQATIQAEKEEDEGNEVALNSNTLDMKLIRSLVSEITQCGASLYDILEKEPDLRAARVKAITRNMDMEDIEKHVKQAIGSVSENIASVEKNLAGVQRDEKSLEAKIEKRKSELERSEKRLLTLQSVRPAYMDEYEKLQVDLQGLYTLYVERFRNLQFLEGMLEQHNQREQEKLEEADRALKRMQRRLREEEQRILRGEHKDGSRYESPETPEVLSEGDETGAATATVIKSSAGRQRSANTIFGR
ncbi:hypothetical protein CBR_g48987 [Chara braunii]|uniref:Clusterin-associated protein 1 n=1 Tax=Chara braunii TaxID=69332 RepID=A0A388M3W0_CHABU|nr:hypothetical protein CBR_g48987 [Chara braunii]|eukprot:GBG89278.1 hypothetical protein CBR_g48987 [Chara braunii]